MRLEAAAANEIESWPARSGIDHIMTEAKKNSSLGTKLAGMPRSYTQPVSSSFFDFLANKHMS